VIVPPEQQTLDLEVAHRRSPLAGETLAVAERMIVAPGVGIFRPHEMAEGEELQAGDEIGVVEGPGTSSPVLSPFDGTLMGMLAHPGERLRSGQPIAWLRVA
jgi:biotin carboxyl carrier protein